MDNYIDQFIDLLAEFNMDVYDEKELADNKYRFDILIVEKDINELIARLRVTNAIKKINGLWKIHDMSVLLDNIRVNEKSDTEFNFSIIVEFHSTKNTEDSRISSKKEVQDDITGEVTESKEHHGFDYGPYETVIDITDIELTSDISGKKLDFGDAYIHRGKPITIASKQEVMDLYREKANQRKSNGKLIDDFDDEEYTEEYFEENFDEFADAIDFKLLDEDEAKDIIYEQSMY